MNTENTTEADAPQAPVQSHDPDVTGNVDISEALGVVESQAGVLTEEPVDEAEDAWLAANDSSEETVGIVAAEPESAEENTESPNAEASESTEEGQRAPELADAYAVLRRDGWDPEDLNTLDPERVLAMAETRSKVQGDYDRAYQKLKDIEAGETGKETSAESEAVADTAEATSDSPAQDISQMVAPLAEALALDEDGTRTLVDFQKSLLAPLTQGFEAQSNLLQQTVDAVIGMQAEASRSQLADRFPQLQDPSSDAFKSVQARMDDLSKSGGYDSITALMEAAANIELAPQARADVARAKETVNLFQSNGQPSTQAAAAPANAGPMSIDDMEEATLALLESNDPTAKAQARAMWGR